MDYGYETVILVSDHPLMNIFKRLGFMNGYRIKKATTIRCMHVQTSY